jgi:putative sulfurtransferase dndC
MAECISCKSNETTITKELIEGMQETIRNLYLADSIPWIIGYSGGKDSTAALQLVWLALKDLPKEKLHKTVHIINTDTLVESPVVAQWAQNSLKKMNIAAEEQELPFVTHRLTPKIDNTFWVNLIGRGYPFPRKRFRWCTDRLKIRPVNDFIKDCIAKHGEVILVLGTRKAESANRAKTMAHYEKLRVRELLSPNPTLANELVFSPLEDWNNNDVWLFLMQYKNPWGYNNNELLTMYRGATADGECPMMVEAGLPSCGKSRFGCWVCTMVEQDKSMEAMIANDSEKEWMTPLLEFRNEIGDEKTDKSRRDFRRRGGYLQGCNGTLNYGPYTKSTREMWLEKLLKMQIEINENGSEEFENLELITIPELAEIRKIWVYENHEFDDSLPKIYKKIIGKTFPDKSIYTSTSFREKEWNILEEICDPDKNDNEMMLFEMMYTLIDIESKSNMMNNRKGILDQIEKTIKKNFFKDSNDASEYYFERIRRKKDHGAKFNDNILPETNEEFEDEQS